MSTTELPHPLGRLRGPLITVSPSVPVVACDDEGDEARFLALFNGPFTTPEKVAAERAKV